MPDLHLPTPAPESWRPELTDIDARAAAWLAFIAPPKPMPDAPVMTLGDAIAEHIDVMDHDDDDDTRTAIATAAADERATERARHRWFRR